MTGVITQGARDFGHIQYVAAYKVAYSNDSTNWAEYRDQGAVDTRVSVRPADLSPLQGCASRLAGGSEGGGGGLALGPS